MMNALPAEHPFGRLELLVGPKRLGALAEAKVAVFGVGGVGSWCAEGLVRSGVGTVTVVDPDVVCASNINRQLQAMPASVGASKVEAIAGRLKEINPAADIAALRKAYNRDTEASFGLSGYDYVIDAIDRLSNKVDLIINASASGATLFSALGAANKVDPARMKVSSIWKTDKCKLGRFVRKRLRRRGFGGDFLCVWSDEPCFCYDDDPSGRANIDSDTDICADHDINAGIDTDTANIDEKLSNQTVNGSLVCVTGVFGFTLSGLVVQDIIKKTI